jgi:predicted nucleotidyltransferase
VKLAVMGNATVGEWLRSPWVYCGDASFAAELLGLVGEVVDPVRLRRHYLHVGRAQWDGAGAGHGLVKLKKVFYAIRPAVTLHWLDDHGGVPPMNLDELLDAAPPPADVAAELQALREQKSRTRELGSAQVPPAIEAWVHRTFSREEERTAEPDPERRERASEGFRMLLEKWAPPGPVAPLATVAP